MAHTPDEIVAFVFMDVAIVIIAARLMGRLFIKLGQPAVVGEIVAGLLLGPSLLGQFPGDLDHRIFPTDVRPFLTVLAALGLVLFMFIVGLEVDLTLVRGRERIAGLVSFASVATPFALGFGLAAIIYHDHDIVKGHKVSFASFALFIGVAMSITAFPVLARMLADRGMHRTPTGVLALACAAVDDIIAWTLLAVVVAVTVGGDFTGVLKIILETIAFALVMFLIVRPLLKRLVDWYGKAGRLTPDMLALILAGVLISAYATQEIGIHYIFGAFVFGIVMPREGAAELTHEILERLEQVSVLLLLPVFFVVTGLGVDVGGIGGSGVWQLVLVLVVAIVGKFSGASLAARAQRVPQRQATALGVLMNTRGLTELVILNVGASLGVLDPRMFTLLVLMAVITTIMTAPLLRWVYPMRIQLRDIEEAEQAGLGAVDAYTVMVVTDGRAGDVELVRLAATMLGHEAPAGVTLVRILPHARAHLEVATGLGVELAQLAAAGDDLRRLSALATDLGTEAAMRTQIGDDPRQTLLELAERAKADVILAFADWALTADGVDPGWPDAVRASIVLVPADFAAGTDGAVVAVLDSGDGARATLRVAAHASLSRRVELRVQSATGRTSRRAVDAMRRAGMDHIDVAADSDLAAAGLIFVADGAPVAEGTELDGRAARVIAGLADSDRDFSEIATRIAVG